MEELPDKASFKGDSGEGVPEPTTEAPPPTSAAPAPPPDATSEAAPSETLHARRSRPPTTDDDDAHVRPDRTRRPSPGTSGLPPGNPGGGASPAAVG